MEVYFVDVGKGTSNVVLLGQGRAIIVDCGQNARGLMQLLKHFQVHQITRLVVSHNHQDHAGGSVAVLTEYEGCIDQVCFLKDGLLYQTKFWEKVHQQINEGILSRQQIRLLHCDDRPAMLFEEQALDLTLKILAPNFLDNLQAEAEGDPNATSGVLLLRIQGKAFVFAGDSTIRQWRSIREQRGLPIDCEVLSIPHHAGLFGAGIHDLEWLYADGVIPQYAVISVASNNTDKHPREEVIRTITSAGSKVLCTQITTKCCLDLESLRPGVRTPDLPGQSKPGADISHPSGRSRNVACAGTVKAEVSNRSVFIHRFVEHQAGVDGIISHPGGFPLCRR